MRKKIVAGNWKMNFTPPMAKAFVESIKDKINTPDVEVVLCVPYVDLQSVKTALKDTHIKVGAQNMHYMDEGAYTGEISGAMLEDIGVHYVIIGHSERRERFGETDTTVNLKILKALEHKIIPIVCVGESQRQQKENRTGGVLAKQVAFALHEVCPEAAKSIVIAYEPIWAIGTGLTATKEQAEDACALIRRQIADIYNEVVAGAVRILYGGSVSPANAKEIFSMPNIDGGLIGGASVVPTFEKVVHFE